MKFVEWASKRGGDSMNDTGKKHKGKLTEEEIENKKPFWARSYYVGTKEFKLDPAFIDEYMERPNFILKDNKEAYLEYK